MIPSGSWDSHMHVVDTENYPLSSAATYHAASHTLDEAIAFEESVGLYGIVFVQPSIYGNDNSCLLDCLRKLDPSRSRGVVVFNPDETSESQLREWHDLGVRGVRINIHSTGLPPGGLEEVIAQLHRCADLVRPLNWVIQLYTPMHLIEVLEAVIPTLNIRFCIDHLGQPDLRTQSVANPYNLPGFAAMIRLVEQGQTFVKLSAPYRITQPSHWDEIEPLVRELMKVKGGRRLVFSTDWPHTRLEGLDIKPWFDLVLSWCGEDEAIVAIVRRKCQRTVGNHC